MQIIKAVLKFLLGLLTVFFAFIIIDDWLVFQILGGLLGLLGLYLTMDLASMFYAWIGLFDVKKYCNKLKKHML
jgi:putative effector of murein hydrolase LrgA (UPF0299 family)